MKKAQVEYDSKGKNGSWDTNRLVREYIGIALMTNDSISRKDFIFSSSRKASALSCSFFFFSDSLFRKATRSQRLERKRVRDATLFSIFQFFTFAARI